MSEDTNDDADEAVEETENNDENGNLIAIADRVGKTGEELGRLTLKQYAARKLVDWAPYIMFLMIIYGTLSTVGILPEPPVPPSLKAFIIIGGVVGAGVLPLSVRLVKRLQDLKQTIVFEIKPQSKKPIRRYTGGHKLAEDMTPQGETTAYSYNIGKYTIYLVTDFNPETGEYKANWLGGENDLKQLQTQDQIAANKQFLSDWARYGVRQFAQREQRLLDAENRYYVEMASESAEDVLQHPEHVGDEELDDLMKELEPPSLTGDDDVQLRDDSEAAQLAESDTSNIDN